MPGKRSDTMPLKSGTSTDDSLAMFMSFIDSSNNYTRKHTHGQTYTGTYAYIHTYIHIQTDRQTGRNGNAALKIIRTCYARIRVYARIYGVV